MLPLPSSPANTHPASLVTLRRGRHAANDGVEPGFLAQRAGGLCLVEPLTASELRVLALICDGDSNRDIARRLQVGLPTVKFHVNQIFGKLGVKRRTQAVAVAIHLRILAPSWLPPLLRDGGTQEPV